MHALVAQGGCALLRVHHGRRVHRGPAQSQVRPQEEVQAVVCVGVSEHAAARVSQAKVVAEGLRMGPNLTCA